MQTTTCGLFGLRAFLRLKMINTNNGEKPRRIGGSKKDVRKGFTRISNNLLDTYIRYLKPSGFAVYCIIHTHTYGKDYSYPGHKLIAEKIGTSQRTVVRAIKHLTKLGVISVTKKRLESGKWRKNIYTLKPVKGWRVPHAIPSKNQGPVWHGNKLNTNKEIEDLLKGRSTRRFTEALTAKKRITS